MGAGGAGMKVAVMLRAVNLAGSRLKMADFKAALAGLGHPGAETVAATGNAVIEAEAADAALEARLQAGLGRALGQETEVFVRDGAQLAAIVAANPFPQMARDDPSHLVVTFIRGAPAPADLERLQASITGPEEVRAGPGCLYTRYPDDIGHSKLTGARVERALKVRGTGRNWNTVLKLRDLTG